MSVVPISFATLLAGLVACHQPDSPGVVMISIPVTVGDVERMEITVSDNGNAPFFSDIVQELLLVPDPATGRLVASGTVEGIPAGAVRLFSIRAYDADGEAICAGDETAFVIDDNAIVVSVLLQCSGATAGDGTGDGIIHGEFNHQPSIDEFNTDRFDIFDDGALGLDLVNLEVLGSDLDGDPLTYRWVDDCGGHFSSPNTGATTWEAPNQSTACILTVTLRDPREGVRMFMLPEIAVTQAKRRVFGTTGLYSGNLGGIAGADAKCQAEADSMGIRGTWMAWLADDTTSPARRFIRSQVPYVLLDGRVIARHWDDLLDGRIEAPIGNFPYAWSNVASTTGVAVGADDCSNWTSDASGPGAVGRAVDTSTLWSAFSVRVCSLQVLLYCFER